MIYPTAAILASTLSFIVFLLMATWYLVPWLKSRGRADALTVLLWIHAFRYVALQIFSTKIRIRSIGFSEGSDCCWRRDRRNPCRLSNHRSPVQGANLHWPDMVVCGRNSI